MKDTWQQHRLYSVKTCRGARVAFVFADNEDEVINKAANMLGFKNIDDFTSNSPGNGYANSIHFEKRLDDPRWKEPAVIVARENYEREIDTNRYLLAYMWVEKIGCIDKCQVTLSILDSCCVGYPTIKDAAPYEWSDIRTDDENLAHWYCIDWKGNIN